MGTSVIGQFLVDKEVQVELEKQEQLKRIGHNFIRVAYTGRHQAPRYHGFHNIGIVMEFDPVEGKDIPRAVLEDRVVEFYKAPDGRFIADILDDEWNRMAISRQLDMNLEVIDSTLAREIAALTKKPYDPEPDRKTQLLRDKKRIEEELAAFSSGARRGPKKRVVGNLTPINEFMGNNDENIEEIKPD
jgi:hypothetical protein